ncbi:hypothetical protein H5410_046219 [Solanum commersonii]|uniref:DUF4283 domain-containing protein n=1 Tax=Solanum commersonii TaxID=4109 RepID=A0A9J5XBP3_SOLCO|nr:hypothetical protein H5410_046219 [Solanum commersonii]
MTKSKTFEYANLDFSNFDKTRTSPEEIDDSSVEDEIHLKNADGKETPKRRLHFSGVEMSKHPTPAGDSDKGNHNNGKTLNFIPHMLKEGILTESETPLIDYIIGDNPYELQMLEYAKKVLYHDDGYYVLKFCNIAEKEYVMQAGPYFFGNMPMILRNWYVDFELDGDMFSQIPIWVKFPRLPVRYWSFTTLSKVASAMRIRLGTDGFTAKAEKISYARVLFEIDISKVLPDTIVVETPSGPWNQSIEYEWRPKFYNNCIKLGHMENECWFKDPPDGKRDKTE